jgi:hypothetical protein
MRALEWSTSVVRWVSNDCLRSFCGLCVAVLGDALRAILHPEVVRRPHPEDSPKPGVKERKSLPTEPPGDKGSANVDATRNSGGREVLCETRTRVPNLTSITLCI